MATFFIPGFILTSVSTLGGAAPETGYLTATVIDIERHATRVQSRKVTLMFDNGGFTTSDWLTIPFDDDGNILSQYEDKNNKGTLDKKGRGCVSAVKTMLFSAGYDNSQMAEGATDDWLVGKTVHLEWHAAADLGAQYGDIAGYITPKLYEALMAEGKLPAIAGGSAASLAPAPTPAIAGVASVAVQAAAPVPASVALPPAPDNGTPAPSAGASLPLPPPPSVTSLVN